MKDFRFREEIVGQLLHPRPGGVILLTPSPERSKPESDNLVPELAERRKVGGHGVVGEEASDNLRQPVPLLGDRLVHPPPQLLLDFLELGPHAVPPGFPLEQKRSPAAATTNEGEPEKIEGLRFAEPAPCAPGRRVAAELDQAGLVRME